MKPVITLIGLAAGTIQWMSVPEAEAAVATGVARWATPEEMSQPPLGDSPVPAEQLAIKYIDGALTVAGRFPQRAILTSRALSLPGVVRKSDGAVVLTFGSRSAHYRMVSEIRGEVIGELISSTDASEVAKPVLDAVVTKPAAPIGYLIPDNWTNLHWKHRIQLASKISGREIIDVEEANSIIGAAKN